MDESELLTVAQVAPRLGMTEAALRTAMSRNQDHRYPPFIRWGSRGVRFHSTVVGNWLDAKAGLSGRGSPPTEPLP